MSNPQKNIYKKFLGRTGESRAASFLKKNKYKIIAKNYETKIGEIDIIAIKDGFYIFIEVKTRVNDKFGRPCEAVNFTKQKKYHYVATQFLNEMGLVDVPCRFDIIEITPQEINHIENAF